MLPTELFYVLVGFTAFNVAMLAIFAWRVAKSAALGRNLASYVHNQNKNAVSLRKIAELDAAVTELTDAHYALYESNKKLRARIGMRAVREKRKSAENGVDLTAVPADEGARLEYKRKLRNKLKAEGRL